MSRLKTVSQAKAIDLALEYITNRRLGQNLSLKTKFNRLNNALMGGIEINTITTLSALSGGGKSTLAKALRSSIAELNDNVKQLCFNFELLANQQVGRELSTKLQKQLRTIYSVDAPLSDEEFEQVKEALKELQHHDITYVEVPQTADKIKDMILKFWESNCKPSNSTLFVELDHCLLTKGRDGDTEKDKIDKLMEMAIEVKKTIADEGGKCCQLYLSQMNRNIRSVERINNPSMHTPLSSDLFGAF